MLGILSFIFAYTSMYLCWPKLPHYSDGKAPSRSPSCQTERTFHHDNCPFLSTRHTPSHYNMEVSRGVPIATWTCGQCARTVPNPYAKTPHPTVLDHHRPSSTIPTLEGMAGWFSWVSGKRDNKNTARDAIIGLREQLHLIAKKEEHLQTKIDEELRKAKDNVTSNKRGTFEAWDSRLGN